MGALAASRHSRGDGTRVLEAADSSRHNHTMLEKSIG